MGESGSWARNARYGAIWYPPASADWTPFRNGRWAWVAPWGWTWLDDADWGFATSHYGRWADIGGRWAWTPAVSDPPANAPPIYAPALIRWVSTAGSGIAATSCEPAAADPTVAWLPLAPQERFLPSYPASDRYVAGLNPAMAAIAGNAAQVASERDVAQLANRRGMIVVPAAAVSASQPIAQRVLAMSRALSPAECAARATPVRPTSATIGVTPAIARTLKLPAEPGPARAPAPGPAYCTQPPADPASSGSESKLALPALLAASTETAKSSAPTGTAMSGADAAVAGGNFLDCAASTLSPALAAAGSSSDGAGAAGDLPALTNPNTPPPVGGSANASAGGKRGNTTLASLGASATGVGPGQQSSVAGFPGLNGGGGVPADSLIELAQALLAGAPVAFAHQPQLNMLLIVTITTRLLAAAGRAKRFRIWIYRALAVWFTGLIFGGAWMGPLIEALDRYAGWAADCTGFLSDHRAPLAAAAVVFLSCGVLFYVMGRSARRSGGGALPRRS